MSSYIRMDFNSAHGAADAVLRAATDCEDARGQSQVNQDRVTGAIDDITVSRTEVQAFMDDLRADLTRATNEVRASDWDSGSKQSFETYVESLRVDMDRIQAQYQGEYDLIMSGMERFRGSVIDLHASFSTASLNFEGALASAGDGAHNYVDGVDQVANQRLGA